MTLTLEITAPPGGSSGTPSRKAFGEEGGTIGRADTNSWQLLSREVSGRHALISFRNGVFYIQDTSRNGVSLNTLDNKLVKDRPYPLKVGDRIFIEPYEIEVSIDDGSQPSAWRPLSDSSGDDPFAPLSASPGSLAGEALNADEVDPLKFFDPVAKPPAPRRQPEVARPPLDALLDASFRPPVAIPDPAMPPSDLAGIPQGYDPLADDSFAQPSGSPPPPSPRPRPGRDSGVFRARGGEAGASESGGVPAMPRRVRESAPAPAPVVPPRPAPVPPPAIVPVEPVPVAPAPVDVQPPPRPIEMPPAVAESRTPLPEPHPRDDAGSFEQLLAGAGLQGAAVTPELAHSFGAILNVVVAGLMDVLQARQRIKEEFRMRQTMFRPADNNPLKFSANVHDALHNLLVKRNPAYLGPVEAFADAFDDLRDHQLAMLAGMRVAFDTMLAEFDPAQLQEEFERQLGKGSFPLMPAKLRYWDLFCEKRRDMVKDPDATFSRLFGEEFARAYEEQFRKLRAQRRGGTAAGPRHPDTDSPHH